MGKQISPLRYPGGKAKLYSYISQLIRQYFDVPPVYCEPFAGGFGLGISLLLNNDVAEVILNDYDYCIYAFWHCVIRERAFKKLICRIDTTDITIEEWKRQRCIYRNYGDYSIEDVGFATLFLNRCNRSGILDANPIGGLKQQGNYKLDCRFNKENLKKTLFRIHERSDSISLFNEEARQFLPMIDQAMNHLFINLDPPYYTAGPMLYKNNFIHEDHYELSQIIHALQNHWILTYDDTPEIREMYDGFLVREYQLNYYLSEKRKATELMIYDNRLIDPISP